MVVSNLNCGLALGYQSEQEAKAASDNKGSNSVLALLGLIGSTSSGGLLSFSPSPLVYSVAGGGKASYDITVNYWPGSGEGELRFKADWSGSMSCTPHEGVFAVSHDDIYPLTFQNVDFSCGITGTGQISHLVDVGTTGVDLPSVDTNVGALSVTTTP